MHCKYRCFPFGLYLQVLLLQRHRCSPNLYHRQTE
nr:MAG TPA: hypothetical protein [Caudoviricetes sp.]